MDALSGLLDGPRARDAFLLRSVTDPPWSVRIQDRAPLSLVVMVRGHAWLVPDGGDGPVPVPAGAAAVMTGPDPYTFADRADTPPQVVIHPGQRCTTPDGRDLSQAMTLGPRTWGTSLTGSVEMLVGTYPVSGEVSRRLLDALPPRLVIPADAWDSPLVPVLSRELADDRPGQDVVLDRLLDLLLIGLLRSWFSRPESGAPAWYRAHRDPVVRRALRLIHHHPAHPWTVAELARRVGTSRAALARRFTRMVGEPPMTYLTSWRLTLAADLLCEPDATVGTVARRVGYGTAFALSAAFKRVRGVSPSQHRAGRGRHPAANSLPASRHAASAARA